MATTRKSPVEQIRTGKPGRPARTQTAAEAAIFATLAPALRTCGLIAVCVPKFRIKAEARSLAPNVIAHLQKAGLSIVPTRMLSELAVFTGESPPADDPSLPKPSTATE